MSISWRPEKKFMVIEYFVFINPFDKTIMNRILITIECYLNRISYSRIININIKIRYKCLKTSKLYPISKKSISIQKIRPNENKQYWILVMFVDRLISFSRRDCIDRRYNTDESS